MVLASHFGPGGGGADDCMIETPRWSNAESSTSIEAQQFFGQHVEEERKVDPPVSTEMLGLPFVDGFHHGGIGSGLKREKDVPFRSPSFVEELLGMAIPGENSLEGSGEFIPQERGNKQILKRRRSLDDDYQRKQVKREKSKQLYERRRSLDSCVTLQNPPYKPLAATTPTVPREVQSRTPKRSNLWTYEEEVFLVAAVMECFLRRGSLTSNRGRDGCWSEIKSFFDLFITNYNKIHSRNKKPGTERASSALYRHFKTLKERISKDPRKDLREYYHRFQFEFNRNNCLLEAPVPQPRQT